MAFDAFLKIDGIEGESTDDKHQNWIEISAFSHGMTQRVADTASSAGARASERASHGQFVVIKDLDKASPKLAVYLNQGKNIDKIRLELCRATGEKPVTWFTNCRMSSLAPSLSTARKTMIAVCQPKKSASPMAKSPGPTP